MTTSSNNINLTPTSLALFLAYAKDAGNWSGQPLIGGNVYNNPNKDRGNITQLKKAGLIITHRENSYLTFIEFTPAGKALALSHGIEI